MIGPHCLGEKFSIDGVISSRGSRSNSSAYYVRKDDYFASNGWECRMHEISPSSSAVNFQVVEDSFASNGWFRETNDAVVSNVQGISEDGMNFIRCLLCNKIFDPRNQDAWEAHKRSKKHQKRWLIYQLNLNNAIVPAVAEFSSGKPSVNEQGANCLQSTESTSNDNLIFSFPVEIAPGDADKGTGIATIDEELKTTLRRYCSIDRSSWSFNPLYAVEKNFDKIPERQSAFVMSISTNLNGGSVQKISSRT